MSEVVPLLRHQLSVGVNNGIILRLGLSLPALSMSQFLNLATSLHRLLLLAHRKIPCWTVEAGEARGG
ncbi:hypothetical protein NC652_039294 [Populus alba x Populus x berolinensis]|nr:hypothetical protein NC652_039294 [Populus alba x Populus x berolinensis]